MNVVLQVASLLGALLILLAYVALQRGRWSSHAPAYLWCNLLGAALLTAVATIDRRIGFMLLEGAWTLITLHSILTRPRR